MIRSFTRCAALACIAAALALTSAAAFAQATITLSDTNCSDFQLTGTPGNRTLTCIVSSAPVCTVTGPATGTTGSPITLTASCAPAATSWVWTGGNCASSTASTCQDTQTLTGNVNYTVKGSNAIGPGNVSPPFTVTWSNTPPAAPSGCSISGAPSQSQAAGYQATLSLNCSGGGQPTSNGYIWTGTGAVGQTTQTVGPITVNATTTFTARASNAGGTSTAASATVSISGGGGGGGGPISCPGFVTTRVIDMAWGPNPRLAYTADVGGFGPNDAIVVRFTTSNITSATGKGYIQAVEYSDSPSGRTAALSAIPCDFTVGLPKVGGGMNAYGPGDIAPWAQFSLYNAKSYASTLQPSTTYYFNISNSPASTCQSTGSCNMLITLSKPSGS
jgi:hypothetical protein